MPLIGIIACLVFVIIGWMISRRGRVGPRRDATGMVGLRGEAIDTFSSEGKIFVRGECWRATALQGIIQKGSAVRVNEVRSGLLLVVQKVEEGEK